jgi:hypothetical protein
MNHGLGDDVNVYENHIEIVYNEKRLGAKTFIFLKTLGLAFYTTTLTTCSTQTTLFICMIVTMAGSIINGMRYEYAHFKKCGHLFTSPHEYKQWKASLWPKSRLFFSIIELILKIEFFIKSFPPDITLYSACHAGQSVLKLHSLLLFILYVFLTIACTILFGCSLCNFTFMYGNTINNGNRSSNSNISNNNNSNSGSNIDAILTIVPFDNERECCICLDKNNQSWSALPCGHTFHQTCILTWANYHQTCPVCRYAASSSTHYAV